MRVLPSERLLANAPEGKPMSDSQNELPPVIRRTEVVAFALVSLLVICVVAVLYAANVSVPRPPATSSIRSRPSGQPVRVLRNR